MVRKYLMRLKRALDACTREKVVSKEPPSVGNQNKGRSVVDNANVVNTKPAPSSLANNITTSAGASNLFVGAGASTAGVCGSVAPHVSTTEKLCLSPSNRSDLACNKITVVGIGDAGMATVFALLAKNVTNNVAMLDVTEDRLKGELMDLQHGSTFLRNSKINASKDYAISADSRIIVVTTGMDLERGIPKEEGLHTNADILKIIIPELVKHSPEAIILVASDPVDPLTYLTWKLSGFPKNRVLGTGTNLDCARFRYLLSERLGIAPSCCHGYIVGEQGENSVPVWSGVHVAGVRLLDLNPHIGTNHDPENWQNIHQQVVNSGYEVQRLKGCNTWAAALSLTDLCESILTNANCVRAVSTHVKDEHGIKDDIFLSLPCVVGQDGVTDIIRQPLTDMETKMLQKSAEVVAHNHCAIIQ